MFRPQLSPRDQLALARARLAARGGVRGAQQGAMAGQAPAQYPQGYGQAQYPVPQGYMPQGYPQQGYPQQAQYPVPQGADAGAMAGCIGGSGCVIPNPFAGMAGPIGPFVQNCSYLGVIATPATFGAFTLSITCGNKFFSGFGARSFNDPLQVIVTSIISGFNSLERTCGPDAGFDIAMWNTDDCWCPFEWGCFSNLAPLTITFDPIDTLSVLPTVDLVIVGNAANLFNDCWPTWPPGGGFVPPPAFPGGGFMAPSGPPVA